MNTNLKLISENMHFRSTNLALWLRKFTTLTSDERLFIGKYYRFVLNNSVYILPFYHKTDASFRLGFMNVIIIMNVREKLIGKHQSEFKGRGKLSRGVSSRRQTETGVALCR